LLSWTAGHPVLIMSLVNRTIDDRDTADLKYAGFWFLQGTWIASNVGESGTLASSSDPNCNVTFTFPVPAVAFYYFGIPRCCGGRYQICVDCDPNNPQWNDIDAVNVTDDGKNPPIVLYSQRFDGPPGVHEVILQNRNDTRFGKSQITLDQFFIEVPGESTTTSSSSTSSSLFPTHTAGTIPQSPPPPSKSSTPVGAIIGGAVAGVVIIGVILIFIFLKRRRRGTTEASELPQHRPPGSSSYTVPNMSQNRPSSIPVKPHHRPAATESSESSGVPYSSTVSTSIAPGPVISPASTAPSINHINHSRDPSSSNLKLDSTSGVTSPTRRGRREVDAGPVNVNVDDEEEETLPPDYRDVFNMVRSPTTSSRNR